MHTTLACACSRVITKMVVSVHFYWLVCFLVIVPIIAAADRIEEQFQTVVERVFDGLDDGDDGTTGSDSEGSDDINLEQNDNAGDRLDKNGLDLARNILTISWEATKVAINTLRSEGSAIDGKCARYTDYNCIMKIGLI